MPASAARTVRLLNPMQPDGLDRLNTPYLETSKMTTATQTYTVRRYTDSQAIGSANLTPEQFAHYEAMAQQPEGLIRLGAMPHDYYDLDEEHQGLHEDTAIYLD